MIPQWLVVNRMDRSGWWILLTIAGFLAGSLLSVRYVVLDLYVGRSLELDPLLIGTAFGAVLGAIQWLALRRWVHQAYWWILANEAGWSAGYLVSYLAGSRLGETATFIVYGVMIWVVAGIITLPVLIWLLRGPTLQAGG
jgi:hypothetical protein